MDDVTVLLFLFVVFILVILLWPRRRYRLVRDFPCRNWAGQCHRHCGSCKAEGPDADDWWVYKREYL